jgi:hypothetical protein
MDNAFRAKVHAAAVAAWWTLLIVVAFVIVQWLGYLLILDVRPTWFLSLCGPGVTWESLASTWFHAMVLLKLGLWPITIAAVWLTLWARQLRMGPPNS